jgi:hypothetical protein
MSHTKWHENIYAVNFTLLFMHEIDSAYWQEWNLFGIPGGIQLFLVINLAMFLAALYGYNRLLHQSGSGSVLSFILSAAGIIAFLIHSYFIVSGHPEFTLPASEILLVTIFILSIIQLIVGVLTYPKKKSPAA